MLREMQTLDTGGARRKTTTGRVDTRQIPPTSSVPDPSEIGNVTERGIEIELDMHRGTETAI